MLAIEVTASPSKADRDAVAKGLGGHNRAAYGDLSKVECWLLGRDAAGAVQAGAKCEIACGWLYIDWLWVAEALRGQDLGTRMLAAAEALAREKGCLGVHLNTWTFQAPGFYRKLGYTEVGRLENMPPGATRYWFAKKLTQGAAP
jgi:ribosomal protein S18 acetylase RimI-like enzyme